MPEFRQAILSNGLRVVAEIDARSYSAALGYFIRSGSRDEVDVESGLSHFLEHMMFKGTSQRSAADVNRELDELGGLAGLGNFDCCDDEDCKLKFDDDIHTCVSNQCETPAPTQAPTEDDEDEDGK